MTAWDPAERDRPGPHRPALQPGVRPPGRAGGDRRVGQPQGVSSRGERVYSRVERGAGDPAARGSGAGAGAGGGGAVDDDDDDIVLVSDDDSAEKKPEPNLSDELLQEKIEIIHQILEDHDQIRVITEPWMIRLQEILCANGYNRNL